MTPLFSTKAETLARLMPLLTTARILPLVHFSVAEWQAAPADCLARITGALGNGPWIVRSSCRSEDSANGSQAGAFLSLLNIDAGRLTESIAQVIGSYGSTDPEDQVLIQPMLTNIVRSGVAFSHDPNVCAPYRIINWHEGSDATVVTSGGGADLHTWQQAAGSPLPPPARHRALLALIDELEKLGAGQPVDCEFAITRDNGVETLWLLQARPLLLNTTPTPISEHTDRLSRIHARLAQSMESHPFLMGRRTVFGVMPDWNPAEMIGVRPRPLSLSLYRDLVTDSIWAYQRHNYGYRNLRSFPLMPHFFGLPYIDVRLSFNSFIPADLDDALAGRLVDHYIDRLLAEPMLHDKVEFEIVFSCYTLDLPERLQRLAQAGFSADEQTRLADSLRHLTNRIVHPVDGLWRKDAAKLDVLDQRRDALHAANLPILDRIYWLLEDTKRYGTLPFAGLARAGFIAVQLLKSLVTVGIFSAADYDDFLASLSTVGRQLAIDRARLDQASFLDIYGHLRPGTYDILSPRYDEAPEFYFDWDTPPPPAPAAHSFQLTPLQTQDIRQHLARHQLDIDPAGLLDFIRAGVEQREQGKFRFTRNLSEALSLLADYGQMHGFSREDMAYCDISCIKELYVGAADPRSTLSQSITQGRARHADTRQLSLPPLIVKPDDVWAFDWPASRPNFITQKQATAPVTRCATRDGLAGAIVCIENADPGYDWVFSYPIAGLLTAWGGANSHMAIRAGELGIPAVIGAGETLYRNCAQARRLHIDCAGQRIDILS